MITRVPAIPGSIAALIMLVGLGLMYWSLTGLGLLVPSPTTSRPADQDLPGKPGAIPGEGVNPIHRVGGPD